MGILDGKNILVTGVTMNTSIAYKVAEVAEQQGATVIVTAFGRALRLATKVVQKLDPVPQVIELDASNADELAALPGNYKVYPGHEGSTSLEYERRFNPYMLRPWDL